MLGTMARALPPLFSSCAQPQDPEAIGSCSAASATPSPASIKWSRKRATSGSPFSTPSPISPRCCGLAAHAALSRDDGRAAVIPLPETLRPRLEAPLTTIAEAAAAHLLDCSAALTAGRAPAASAAQGAAFDSYSQEIATLREEGIPAWPAGRAGRACLRSRLRARAMARRSRRARPKDRRARALRKRQG